MGKEQITVEVDADLMDRLRAAGVDPQAYLQILMDRTALETVSPQDRVARSDAWARENREAIAEYNTQVEQIGTFASRQRARRKNAPECASLSYVDLSRNGRRAKIPTFW